MWMLIAPYWAVRTIVDKVKQRKKDREFTWNKYWDERQ